MRRIIPLFLLALLALPSAAEAKTYWLDTYEANAKGFVGPLRTEKLDKKVPYVATAHGTFSVFAPAQYKQPYCGRLEPRPVFKSPKRPNGPVNSDVAFLFANTDRSCARSGLSQSVMGQTFQIAPASKYRDSRPFGVGTLTAPLASHKYNYAVIGAGRQLGFRIPESYAGDNYGRIRLNIRRARARDCVKGFSAFGYVDEASCLKAVAGARAR